MSNNFAGSFKIYVDPRDRHVDKDPKELGHGGPDEDPYALEAFYKDVYNVKEDIKHMEKLCTRLEESTEEFKAANTAKAMMELRARGNMDMDHVLKLAKLISKKYDGLVRTNAAHRKIPGSGPGSSNDQARTSMISELGGNLKNMIRRFQGLRVRTEASHKEVIESRFLLITGEKATEEAIENLLSCDEHEGILYEAMQKHGRGAVLDAITEIEERRDAMKEARKNLMNLHQILLGIASPVEGPGGVGGGGLPSPVESHVSPAPNPLTAIFARKVGVGKLNDYEKETRNQAYIALAIALICSIIIITVYLYRENAENNELLPPAQ